MWVATNFGTIDSAVWHFLETNGQTDKQSIYLDYVRKKANIYIYAANCKLMREVYMKSLLSGNPWCSMYNKTKTFKKVPEPYLNADRTRFPPETGVSASTWSADGVGVLGSVGSVLAKVLDAVVVVVVVAFSVVGWRIKEDDVLVIIFSFSL